jgi:hypothetical protein
MYCLNNGKRNSVKVQKKTYDNKPFFGGEIIKCSNFEKKPAVSFSDGHFEEIKGEYCWWLNDYSIVTNEEFDKILKEIIKQ